VSTLVKSPYYHAAQEILVAEANPGELKVNDPWYTVVPTDLVRLWSDSMVLRFKLNR
jgi:hypothetical protein